MTQDSQPSRILVVLGLLAGFLFVVSLALGVYRPDRPVPDIVPGSSTSPTFVVQIIRPRLGLPLGGILPPQIFGQEARLGFDSSSPGASVGRVGPRRIELGADGWELVLVGDGAGRASPETRVTFTFLFEGNPREVVCRAGDPTDGTLRTTSPGQLGELSGSFDIELVRCEDADTGDPLGWPPNPLVLHGSFDRLPLDTGS